jgi:hypothetical protein
MKVSFTDFNLRDCLVIIKTDALCKHHAMTTQSNRAGNMHVYLSARWSYLHGLVVLIL